MDVPNQGLGIWTERPWHQTAKCLMKETHIHTNVENYHRHMLRNFDIWLATWDS